MKQAAGVSCLYTRREGVVRGPYTSAQVTRYILLGRIRLDDELSHDQREWLPADGFAALIPEELATLESWSDYQRLVEARLRVDERRGERRCTNCPGYAACRGERRSGKDRRAGVVYTRGTTPDATRGVTTQEHAQRPALLRTTLLGLLLATLVFYWLVPTGV